MPVTPPPRNPRQPLVLSRGEKHKEATNNYNGVTYRFSFAPATDSISISGVSFLGLPKKSKVQEKKVTFKIEMGESTHFRTPNDWGNLKILMEWQPFHASLQKGKETYLPFPYDVHVDKGLWVDLGFTIDDDIKTETLKEDILSKTELLSETGGVVFDVTRSRQPLQLSKLHFNIDNHYYR